MACDISVDLKYEMAETYRIAIASVVIEQSATMTLRLVLFSEILVVPLFRGQSLYCLKAPFTKALVKCEVEPVALYL